MTINIRGQEFDHTPFDLDDRAAVRVADEILKNTLLVISSASDGQDNGELESLYAAYSVYFDSVLGEGSLSKILGGKRNPVEATDVYYDLRDARIEAMVQRAAEVSVRQTIPDKYNPESVKM